MTTGVLVTCVQQKKIDNLLLLLVDYSFREHPWTHESLLVVTANGTSELATLNK